MQRAASEAALTATISELEEKLRSSEMWVEQVLVHANHRTTRVARAALAVVHFWQGELTRDSRLSRTSRSFKAALAFGERACSKKLDARE